MLFYPVCGAFSLALAAATEIEAAQGHLRGQMLD